MFLLSHLFLFYLPVLEHYYFWYFYIPASVLSTLHVLYNLILYKPLLDDTMHVHSNKPLYLAH